MRSALGATGSTVAVVIGLLSASCAGAADTPQTVQLMVKTAAPSPGDAADITTRQVAASAGVPASNVRYLAASGGDWHAVSVQCDTAARCDEVVARLIADKNHFAAVTRDERRKAQTGSAQ